MAEETFAEFMDRYGVSGRTYPVFHVGDTAAQWPAVIVRFGDKTALVRFCGVGADGSHPHLSIDVYAFVADHVARAGVVGIDNGKRYTGFDDTAPGRSHGCPAVRGVSVLIGEQHTGDA